MTTLRALTAADLPAVLRLNNAATPAVPHSTPDDVAGLLNVASHAFAAVDDADALLGFVIALEPGRDYGSENYCWFEARGTDFLYVDRIVVDEAARGRRIGRLLYDRVFELAARAGRIEVTCEVNVKPPNPGSLAFHARLGFVEVGRQSTKGGSVEVALLAAPALG